MNLGRPHRYRGLWLAMGLGVVPFVLARAATAETLKLSLAESLQRGRAASKPLEQSRLKAAAARDARSVIASQFLPSLSAEFTVGTAHDRDPTPSEPIAPETARDYNKYRGALVLRQPIFSGLSDYAAYQEAGATVEQRDIELSDQELVSRQQIIESYFEIQLDLEKIAAEEEVESSLKQQLAFSTNKYRAGSSTELDVLRARYEVQSQQPKIAELRTALEKKKLRFAHLLGLSLDQPFELSVSLVQANDALRKEAAISLPKALSEALTGNTKIRGMQAERQKLEHELSKIRSKHWPKLDVVLQAESYATLREEIGTERSQKYSAMVELKVPLFTGLSSVHERAEAGHRLAESSVRFEDTKQNLLQDLNAALRDYELSGLRSDLGKANVELARRTADQSRSQYNAGRSTLTDVMDTYAKLVQARKDYAQALFDGVKAMTQVQTLMGRPMAAEAF